MEGFMTEEEEIALAMRESLESYQRGIGQSPSPGRAPDSQSQFHGTFGSGDQPYRFHTGDEDADLARALNESMYGIGDGHQARDHFEPQTYERHRDVASYMPSDRTKKELRLVFLGMTGVGKSSSANTVIGRKEFKADCDATSITYCCNHANAKVHGRDVVVVDTPGLFDTRQGNEKTLREITRCVYLSAPGPHALILVVQGGNRQTKQVQQCADMIMDVFGDQARRYLLILITHRDDIEYHGQTIHRYVQTLPPKMQQVLSQCGNRYLAFNNRVATPAERDAQVKELFAMVDNIVAQNGGRCFTNDVYKDFEKMLKARERQLQEELDRQRAAERVRFQQEVEQEAERQMNILRSQEREAARRREQREQERERKYQQEQREKERERERDRERNAHRMKQEDLERERREFESLQRERKQQREREMEQERERRQREDELARERQLRLEADTNAKMNEKLMDQDRRYADKMDNLRHEVRIEVQRDEEGAGELFKNGVAKIAKGIRKGVEYLAKGAASIFKWIFN